MAMILNFIVQDRETRVPLAGVQVSVGNVTGQTDNDGKLTLRTDTPATLPTTLSKSGYETHSFNITYRDRVIANYPILLVPSATPPAPPTPPRPPPQKGLLIVEGTPSNARVLVNLADKGQIPVQVELEPGNYSVNVTASGYRTAIFPVTIQSAASTIKRVALERSEPRPPSPSPLDQEIFNLAKNLTSGEKAKVSALTDSEKREFLDYLKTGFLVGEDANKRMAQITGKIYSSSTFNYDQSRNEFIRDYGTGIADFFPTIAPFMAEIDPAWWSEEAGRRAQEAGVTKQEYLDNYMSNLAASIGYELGLTALGPQIWGAISRLVKPLGSMLGNLIQRLIPSSIMRSALVSSTRGALGNPFSGIATKIKEAAAKIVAKFKRAPKSQYTQQRIDGWEKYSKDALKVLREERAAGRISESVYQKSREEIRKAASVGVTNNIRGYTSKIINGQIPLSEAIKEIPHRFRDYLFKNKALTLISSIYFGEKIIGTFAFTDFIGEETVQTAGFGKKTALDTFKWSQPENWEDTKAIAEYHLQQYGAITEKLKEMGSFMRGWNIISGAAFREFYDAALLNYESNKSAFEIIVKEGPKNGDADKQEAGLEIFSVPARARIYLNDEYKFEQTPTNLMLPAGDYKLTLKLTGYHDLNDNITLAAHTSTYKSYTLTPLDDEPRPPTPGPEPDDDFGSIKITSTPRQARIYINHEYKFEKTPTTLMLPVGNYVLGLKLDDYQDLDESIRIEPNSSIEKHYDLMPFDEPPEPPGPGETGRIMITTIPPGVSVRVPGEGERVTDGTGMLDLDLPAGTYEIEFSKEGYKTEYKTVYLNAQAAYPLRVFLEEGYTPPSPPDDEEEGFKGWKYDLITTPAGAKIVISGSFVNKWTPDYVILAPNAQYLIEFVKSGYETAQVLVTTDPAPQS